MQEVSALAGLPAREAVRDLSAVSVLEPGDNRLLARVDRTVHGGHLPGCIEDVAEISWLGVEASPYLVRVDLNNASDLFINHLMLIPDQTHQVTDQESLFVGDLAVSRDDEPRDPENEMRVLTPPAQPLGEFDDPGLVPEDSSRRPVECRS
jgi:hypothetical protein